LDALLHKFNFGAEEILHDWCLLYISLISLELSWATRELFAKINGELGSKELELKCTGGERGGPDSPPWVAKYSTDSDVAARTVREARLQWREDE
jgi:hypothetical protein